MTGSHRQRLWYWSMLGAFGLAAAAVIAVVSLPRDVTVIHPAFGPAVQAVYATGTVEPTVMIPIAPRVGGRLVELNVDEGARVSKGQVLARLEAEDVLSNLRQLQAQQDFARRDYERNATMLKEGVIARQVYDRSKADWNAAVAATARARAEAGFMTLTAPDTGIVIRRDGEIGQLLQANQALFWLAGVTSTRVSADVDEEDISKIQLGQSVLIRADAFPGRVFSGNVLSVTPKGDPIARSYRVRISIPTDAPLMIGMTAEANIIVHRSEHVLLVPSSAVVSGKVWVVRAGKLAPADVVVGVAGTDKTEIRSGISGEDFVVQNPGSTFHTGERVRAVLLRVNP